MRSALSLLAPMLTPIDARAVAARCSRSSAAGWPSIVEAHAVDDRAVLLEPEQARPRIARLRPRRERADLDEAEAQPEHLLRHLGILVEARGEPDGRREIESRDAILAAMTGNPAAVGSAQASARRSSRDARARRPARKPRGGAANKAASARLCRPEFRRRISGLLPRLAPAMTRTRHYERSAAIQLPRTLQPKGSIVMRIAPLLTTALLAACATSQRRSAPDRSVGGRRAAGCRSASRADSRQEPRARGILRRDDKAELADIALVQDRTRHPGPGLWQVGRLFRAGRRRPPAAADRRRSEPGQIVRPVEAVARRTLLSFRLFAARAKRQAAFAPIAATLCLRPDERRAEANSPPSSSTSIKSTTSSRREDYISRIPRIGPAIDQLIAKSAASAAKRRACRPNGSIPHDHRRTSTAPAKRRAVRR